MQQDCNACFGGMYIMKKKLIILISSLVAVAAIAVAVIILVINKKDGYRLLKIFEVDGKAMVERTSIGEIEPYKNMVLESGDRIGLDEGELVIAADEDKYIYLEEGTEIVLNASGNKKDSKTNIELVKGSVTNDIQNPLSEDSSYEINTPNSTMAVRGTVYRAYTYKVGDVLYTKVSVFHGKVVTKLVFKDGTESEEGVAIEKGKEVIIYEDPETTDYLTDPTDINYDEIPQYVYEILRDVAKGGRELSISKEEIDERLANGPYVVTFKYGETVFGVQSVKKGACAEIPALAPSTSGSWNFDFTTPITKDTTIQWQ